METRAEMVYSKGLLAFERHKRTAAGGYFIRPLEAAVGVPTQDLTTLARLGPGVSAPELSQSDHHWHVYMRTPGGSITGGVTRTCTPAIYVDGIKTLRDFDDLLGSISPEVILGLEVYTHFGEVPLDYPVSPLSACGVLALWTRPPGTLKAPAVTPP